MPIWAMECLFWPRVLFAFLGWMMLVGYRVNVLCREIGFFCEIASSRYLARFMCFDLVSYLCEYLVVLFLRCWITLKAGGSIDMGLTLIDISCKLLPFPIML